MTGFQGWTDDINRVALYLKLLYRVHLVSEDYCVTDNLQKYALFANLFQMFHMIILYFIILSNVQLLAGGY